MYRKDCEFSLCEVWEKGGEGGIDLASKLLKTLEEKESNYRPLYGLELSIKEKIETIAKEIYGADKVTYDPAADMAIKRLKNLVMVICRFVWRKSVLPIR